MGVEWYNCFLTLCIFIPSFHSQIITILSFNSSFIQFRDLLLKVWSIELQNKHLLELVKS